MASPPLAQWRFAALALVAIVAFAGFTRTGKAAAPTVASSSGQPARGSASADAYPDWAAAVVPAYTSKVTSKGRTTDQFYDVYQINTADPYATVLAWYKAHGQTTWPDRHPNQTFGKVGKVGITLQKAESSDGTRTTIGFRMKL